MGCGTVRTSAAWAAARRASSVPPGDGPPSVRPLLLTFGGTDDRALAERGGGALPRVRPGWEKGSESLDSPPQMLPIMDLVWFARS